MKLISCILLLVISGIINAQPTQPQFPNTCTSVGFAVLNPQATPADNNLYTVSSTGVYTAVGPTNVPALNAIGMDGRLNKRYIWGMNQATMTANSIPANLYRIGSDGLGVSWATIAPPPLAAGDFGRGVLSFAADMNPLNGTYYVPAVVINSAFPLRYTFYIGTFNVDDAPYAGVVTPTYSVINLGNCSSAVSTFMNAYVSYIVFGGAEPSGLFQDLALNVAQNKIYGFMGVENKLMTMDLATGTATCTDGDPMNGTLGYTGCTGGTTCEIGGLFFAPDGTLIATQVDRGNTYSVNTTTGALTLLSSGGFAADSRGDASVCASIAMIPTPVKLTSFSAIAKDCNALVQWVTSQEINSDRFEIENSIDGINYEKIAQVKSKSSNSSSNLNYSTVVSLAPGTSFIRLKQIDFDGKFDYSKVVTVTTGCTISWNKNIRVYPTLLQEDIIHVQFYADAPHKMNLSLHSADGKLIKQQQRSTSTGNNNLELETTNLAKGFYLLKVAAEDGTSFTTRITKQ